MMREEIDVDRDAEHDQRPCRRMRLELEMEQRPGAAEIAADAGIHEAGEQRHAADAQDRLFGVDPGADRGLEDLHGRADHMEDEDDLGLLPGLEPEGEHAGLDQQRGQEQEIVAGNVRPLGVGGVRRYEESEHQSAKQACPSLLHAEAAELIDERPPRLLLCPRSKARLGINEARQRSV